MGGKDETELARLMRSATAGNENAYADFLQRADAIVRGFARRKIVQGGVEIEVIHQGQLTAG